MEKNAEPDNVAPAGDLNTADFALPSELTNALWCGVDLLGSALVFSYASPWFLLFFAAAGAAFSAVMVFYIASARQLKRLEAVSQSPVLSHLHETLSGAAVVRAHGWGPWREAEFGDLLEGSSRCHYLSSCAFFWLGARLDVLGAAVAFAVSLLVVVGRSGGAVTAGLAGLCVCYSMEGLTAISWMVHNLSRLETDAVSLERIFEYVDLPQEAEGDVRETDPGPDWPGEGQIRFRRFSARYRPGLPLALKGVDLVVAGGERLGVCGRTGAGKTSLVRAIFRMAGDPPSAGGSLELGGVDVTRVGLARLRRSLAAIPQEPVLFSGTLRFNLDPAGEHPDSGLWEALGASGLQSSFPGISLEFLVEAGGANLSAGQRQLVGLVRALLRRQKGASVLVMDEATSSADPETDAAVRSAAARAFAGQTVVTVAHRPAAVADCDRVVVLRAGQVTEVGPPEKLSWDFFSAN